MPENRVNRFVASLRDRQANANGHSAAVVSNESPSSNSTTDLATPVTPFFDPDTLSKLGRLDLIARTVVDGILSGKHRSTHKGGCTDFSEFRPYAKGDDIRQLDWRQFAKSDRYYVKRYDDETNLQALMIVDSSGSMQFGMSTVSKWEYARMASAALGHLLLRQRDSVGLAVVGEHLVDYLRPLPRSSHLARVLDVLGRAQTTGEAALDEVLQEVAGRLKRRGLVILFSDCFGDVEKIKDSLLQFRLRGHDVLVFQVLAPEELTFPFRRESFFQDLELPRRLQINPNTVRKQYLKEFSTFMEKLKEAMVDIGADLVTLTTDGDLGDSLVHYLRRRAASNSTSKARRA